MDTVHLTTADGVELTADLDRPDGDEIGGVVVCHPHPAYGGNRFNIVVQALFDALPRAGFVTVRFDFRDGGGGGAAEQLDVVAALDRVEAETTAPLFLTGYSFGAGVALSTHDPRIAATAAIAPPLTMMGITEPRVPTLVLTPRHDQFSPPPDAEPVVRAWSDAEFDVIESADHFLAGHTTEVAERVTAWLTGRAG